MRSEVGRRVRLLRRDVRGLTIAELADGVGISRSYMEKIESGKRDPSMGVCERAAKLLGVGLVELVSNGAMGGDGVLEAVARFRGLGLTPRTLFAWLARRPVPKKVSEEVERPSAAPPEGRPDSDDGEGGEMRRTEKKPDGVAVKMGLRIERLRRTMRPMVTQDTLAERIGVSRGYVSKLERGEIDLPLSLAARVASVLRVPMTELVSDDRGDTEVEEWHRVALEACRAFSGLGMKPAEAVPSIRWLTNLLATYVRKERKRK